MGGRNRYPFSIEMTWEMFVFDVFISSIAPVLPFD